jgi:hypothetical protein
MAATEEEAAHGRASKTWKAHSQHHQGHHTVCRLLDSRGFLRGHHACAEPHQELRRHQGAAPRWEACQAPPHLLLAAASSADAAERVVAQQEEKAQA